MPIFTCSGQTSAHARGHLAVELVEFRHHRQRSAGAVAKVVGIVERRIPEREDRVADVFVERSLVGEQEVAHRGEKGDQELDHLLRAVPLGNAREAADIAHQHGHLALFAAKLEPGGIGGDLLDQLGREIAVERAVDIGSAAFLAVEHHHRLDDVDEHDGERRVSRVEQVIGARVRQPAQRRDRGDAERTDHRPARRAEPRQQQRQPAAEQQHEGELEPGAQSGRSRNWPSIICSAAWRGPAPRARARRAAWRRGRAILWRSSRRRRSGRPPPP